MYADRNEAERERMRDQEFDRLREKLSAECPLIVDLLEYLPKERISELYNELISEIIREGWFND